MKAPSLFGEACASTQLPRGPGASGLREGSSELQSNPSDCFAGDTSSFLSDNSCPEGTLNSSEVRKPEAGVPQEAAGRLSPAQAEGR